MKKIIFSNLLVIPFCLHWLMPDGLERVMYIDFLGVPYFIPNFCFVLYVIFYRRITKVYHDFINRKALAWWSLSLLFLVAYSVVISFINDINEIEMVLLNNQSLVFSSILYFFFPLPEMMIEKTKYVIIPTCILLSLEVILFSLGLMEYSESLGNVSYEGVLRISTTVGAATGTAVAIVMLSVIILTSYNLNPVFLSCLVSLSTLAILLTISRGSIGVWFVFLLYYCYIRFFRNMGFKRKLLGSLLLFSFFVGMFVIGAFNPLISRNTSLEGNFDTNREAKVEEAMKHFDDSYGFGIGLGQTKIEKSISEKVVIKDPIGVHNYYYTVLAELGMPGIVLVCMFFLIMLFSFNYHKTITIYSLMLLTLTFTTEPVFTFEEFMAPAFFVFMISLKREQKNTPYYIQS